MRFTQESALALLRAADVFYWNEHDPEDPQTDRMLNMNDTWAWATAFGEYVPDECLVEVAELFSQYGWCGLLYWVSERNDKMRSEFHDVNRCVEFVRHEEEFKKRIPSSTMQAYTPFYYTLGIPTRQQPGYWHRLKKLLRLA